jgi:transposase
VSATAILAELGDCRRFSSSDNAVRHAGLDVTVYQSDDKRAPGHLSHERPELLRSALYEAAVSAARAGSPDHAYYLQVAQRLGHTRACLPVARKLCRRAYHILRELGEEALAPTDQPTEKEEIAAAA